MRHEIEKRLAPLTKKLAGELSVLVEKQIDATIDRFSDALAAALSVAVEHGSTGGAASSEPIATTAKQTSRRTTAPKPTATRVKQVQRDIKPEKVKAAGKIVCSKCSYVGGNARGCGKPTGHETRTPAARTKAVTSDDSEDEPHAAVRVRRTVQIAEEPRVIPHAALVAMLHADRVNNAVGDVGGFIARADREPSLVGPTDEKREVCPIHGWVGRFAFERDRHELCRDYESPRCRICEGRMVVMGDFCGHCEGTGIEPAPVDPVTPTHEERIPLVAAEGVQLIRLDDANHRNTVRIADRAYTIATKQITKAMLVQGAIDVEMAGPPVDVQRPRTRHDCKDAPRPCGFVTCKHHLYLDVDPETGSIKFNFPDHEPEELLESCSLDVADRGGHVLEDVANLMNITRERARQVETKAKFNLHAGLVESGVAP